MYFKIIASLALSVVLTSAQTLEPAYPDSCYWCISQNFMWDVVGNKCYKNIAGGATTAQICAKTVEMDGLNQIKGYSFTNNT